MNKLTQARIRELRMLANRHGILKPDEVVIFAKNPKTALHSAFDWDDSEAAHKWRIEQARGIIQVAVTVLHIKEKDYKVRVFIAPISYRDGGLPGGYKITEDLLRTKKGRAEILETALSELETFRKKYNWLAELVKVFNAIDEARNLLK